MFVSILTEKVKKAYWFPYDFVKRVAIFKNGNATKKAAIFDTWSQFLKKLNSR